MTDMSGLFNGKLSFNQPIASWDTSNVINMSYLFDAGTLGREFNQPIGSWNTSKVITMEAMFYHADLFNQPIGSWNTGAVTNMSYMFHDATAFNQNISAWDVGAVVPKPPTGFSTNSALTAQNGPVWGIYAYSSHTFTTAGVSGITGPTLSDVRTAYANVGATWASSYVNMTNDDGIQEWTVPKTGSYEIRAVGAGVPYSTSFTTNGRNQFQKGMDATITTTLTRGEVIRILVGQIPGFNDRQKGGAGGTFVVRGTQTPIIVAGGGGGRGMATANINSNATSSNSGQNASPGGFGGTGGSGGSQTVWGGSGGGFTGNGEPASAYENTGGFAFTGGSMGGYGSNYDQSTEGGFGGGGGAGPSGGGGGGYSGGGGGTTDGSYQSSGGGGGSYSITGDFTSATANNNANGFVTITAE
jgi:surface protein